MSLTVSSIHSGTNIITEDIVLSSDFTLPANCVLIFQGGKFVTAVGTTSVIISGNFTTIVAGITPIFGNGIIVEGTWKITEAYPEWFDYDIGNNDDARRISKAASMLNASNESGGVVKLTGQYNIYTTILIPTKIYLEGNNAYDTKIYVQDGFSGLDEDSSLFSSLGSTLSLKDYERLSTYSLYDKYKKEGHPHNLISADPAYIAPMSLKPAIYFYKTYTNNRACGAKNFTLICRGINCDGIVVDKPYDQSIWENIHVENVHISRSAFVFRVRKEENDTNIGVGQSLIINNCQGFKNKTNADDCFIRGISSAPLFKFFSINESTLVGCKAFCYSPEVISNSDLELINNDILYLFSIKHPDILDDLTDPIVVSEAMATPIYKEFYKEYLYRLIGGTGFEFMDCHGITLEGCSTVSTVTAILINAQNKTSAGFTISGFTSENTWNYDLFTDYTSGRDLADLCVLPIRKLNTTSGLMLNTCERSFIVTVREQDISLKKGHHNIIFSVSQVNTILDNSDHTIRQIRPIPAGNTIYLVPSYHTGSRGGVNVSNQLAVRGLTDNAYAVPGSDSSRVNCTVAINALSTGGVVYSNGKERISLMNTATDDSTVIKNNAGNELLKVATASSACSTSLRLQVNVNGTMKFLPIEIGAVDANGYCTLRVKTN